MIIKFHIKFSKVDFFGEIVVARDADKQLLTEFRCLQSYHCETVAHLESVVEIRD